VIRISTELQKRIPGLHQDTIISSVSITDVWEPIEEGLVPLSTEFHSTGFLVDILLDHSFAFY